MRAQEHGPHLGDPIQMISFIKSHLRIYANRDGHYTLDRSKLPTKVDELRVRFVPWLVKGKNTLLVLYPDTETGFEPSYVRYVVQMKLRLTDGTVDQGPGQIVVTAHWIIGLITDGSVGETVLNESNGSVYAFTFGLDDIRPVEIKKNWLGKPIEALILSKEG